MPGIVSQHSGGNSLWSCLQGDEILPPTFKDKTGGDTATAWNSPEPCTAAQKGSLQENSQ